MRSYELGTKNRLFGNRLLVDASAYYIKWKNIQTNLLLPNCAESFTNNIAEATSQGFDLSLQVNPFAWMLITGTVGYNKSQFGADARSPGGRPGRDEGCVRAGLAGAVGLLAVGPV